MVRERRASPFCFSFSFSLKRPPRNFSWAGMPSPPPPLLLLLQSAIRLSHPIYILLLNINADTLHFPARSSLISPSWPSFLGSLDNSEWMRNGDYIPTRMEAQHDAANLVCGTKTQSNPESTVGVLTMAGKSPELLVSERRHWGATSSSLKLNGSGPAPSSCSCSA